MRVVYEIECHKPGTLAVICLHNVVFPLPDGAEMINKIPRRTWGGLSLDETGAVLIGCSMPAQGRHYSTF